MNTSSYTELRHRQIYVSFAPEIDGIQTVGQVPQEEAFPLKGCYVCVSVISLSSPVQEHFRVMWALRKVKVVEAEKLLLEAALVPFLYLD